MTDPDGWAWMSSPEDVRADAHVLIARYLDEIPDRPEPPASIQNWVEALQWASGLPTSPHDCALGRALLDADADRQRSVATAAGLQYLDASEAGAGDHTLAVLFRLMADLLRTERTVLSHDDVAALVGAVSRAEPRPSHACDPAGEVLETVVRGLDADAAAHPRVQRALAAAVRTRSFPQSSRLAETIWGLLDAPLRLTPCEVWSRRILADYESTDAAGRALLNRMVAHAQTCPALPSLRWRTTMAVLADAWHEPFESRFARWVRGYTAQSDGPLTGANRAALPGLIWAAADADVPPIKALREVALACYSKVARRGDEPPAPADWRSEAVGNAALRALAHVDTEEAWAALTALRRSIPHKRARALVDRLLATADQAQPR